MHVACIMAHFSSFEKVYADIKVNCQQLTIPNSIYTL